jgi:hypothetical protein
MNLCGEPICDAPSICTDDQRAPIAVADNAVIFSYHACLERIVMQPGSQEGRARIVGFGDNSLAAQQIVHDEAYVTFACDNRHVIDAEDAAWYVVAKAEGIVDVHIESRGHGGFARNTRQGHRDQSGAG